MRHCGSSQFHLATGEGADIALSDFSEIDKSYHPEPGQVTPR